ncbi:MAG: flagellar biosynthetic protein FliO [Eubacteriales bacterium]|nr:flagellar biosynthetic protein FliO [Eubacteriales bacterium]
MLLVQSGSGLKNIGELICAVLLFLFVLFLAYLAARIAGSFQSNIVNKQANIKVIEVFRLSNNKLIEIVKIGDKYLAIAVSKDNVTLLAQLDEGSIKEQEKALEPINFKSLLEKIKNEKHNK